MDLSYVQFHGRPTDRMGIGRRLPRHPMSVAGEPLSAAVEPRSLHGPAAGVTGLAADVLVWAGLDPAAYRSRPLQRRLGACLRALNVDSESEGCTRLATAPGLYGVALNALLIGVSDFFRDSIVFETMSRIVVPALAKRQGPIRVWSVGCSTGAELYSVAVLLAEAGLLDRAFLMGSDCRADAVASARAGTFSNEALAAVDGALRLRYFERRSPGWRVAERLRQATSWQVADATRDTAEGGWDLVFCRNLVMYLHNVAAETVLRRIVEGISPEGFLVVGKAERPPTSLGLAPVGRCVYRTPANG